MAVEKIHLEKIVQRFYGELENGKIMARRCKDCGAYEFPPVLGCNTCGSWNMEWTEISGDAVVTNFTVPNATSYGSSSLSKLNDLFPFAWGEVRLAEGPEFSAVVCGISKENEMALRKRILDKDPVRCKAKIIDGDGFKTVVFQLVED